MSYSPHRDAGGTLHLPSPTHLHHIDSASALRQLRRSLSRSPSKGPTFRLVMSKSTSPSPNSPLSPSPLSPHLKRESYSPLNEKTFASTTPFAIPFPPTIKKSRSNNRKISPMRTGSRSRSSHRSPVRRGLSDCTDNGNATPSSSPNQSLGAENEVTGSVSPVEKLEFDGALPSLTGRGLDSSLAPSHAWTRFERGNGCVVGFAAKSSPLKRSDGIMNIDHTGLGSPSAKRRSLHGGTFGPDFDIFEHEAVLSAQDQQTGEAQIAEDQGSQESTSNFSPMPRRTSSLRKTTLQQRHEKPLFTRSKPNAEITMDHTSQGPTLSKSRPRMSLENFLPQPVRDSPFSSQGTLPSASIHPICQQRKEMAISSLPQRHPLSRTISQSSNGSSMAEDSPTHVPIRLPEQRKMHVDFSRSLPVGATRPFTRESLSRETSGQSSATEFSFSTPENYKLAKPLPAAFMSTGLISKRNVNIEETQADLRSSNAHMPETPCKRPTSMATIAPIPVPDSVIGNAKHARRSLHSFGTPSTPYNPHTSQPTPGSFGKGTSIFGSNFATGGLVRKGSFASIEVDENSQFSSGPSNSQSSNDNGIQPTPTKNLPEVSSSPFPKSAERDTSFQWAVDHIPTLSPVGHLSSHSRQRSELSPLGTLHKNMEEDEDGPVDESPSTALRFRSFTSISSFSIRSPLLSNSRSSRPFSKPLKPFPLTQVKSLHTKPSLFCPASPINEFHEQKSPHTPQESALPPDPSGLSISAHGNQPASHERSSSTFKFPPATPTTPRDYFLPSGRRRSSITPAHSFPALDVDSSLTSRFDGVELVGTGEFSQVYRVTQKEQQSNVAHPIGRPPPKPSVPDRVWAVKKSRQPYGGSRDRKHKLNEVAILKALGRSDHTVQLFDHWELKNHLYIQTEFCDEGSLDVFLEQAGRKARLDDFRIWKIMLELSQVRSDLCCGCFYTDVK